MSERQSRFSSQDPADIAWRVQQMYENSAIEGIERDPVLAAFVDQMDAEGVPPEEQIRRIIAFDRKAARTAAE